MDGNHNTNIVIFRLVFINIFEFTAAKSNIHLYVLTYKCTIIIA